MVILGRGNKSIPHVRVRADDLLCSSRKQETVAAAKIQSVYRRTKTREKLEKLGLTTAHMRNRLRERQASKTPKRIITDDVPSLFKCCGIGLIL